MKLTEHFSKSEFDCNDGSEMPAEVFLNIEKLAKQLEVLRVFFDKSITINSGYRSPKYNEHIGGATKSQHLLGTASDIVVEGMKPSEVADAVEALIRIGAVNFGGLGRYATFTHLDIRSHRARWNG
jgi:uncharacterized protein YcbK (DUF882 family)